jgi:glycosyltransferase involved in cell wall biosynthesis
MKKTLSFVVIAYNEEKRIADVIRNFIDYGDVIILDGGSTDRTQEICETMGARFYLRPENKKIQIENEENFTFIKNLITTDWIYWGHADYIAPKTLVEKMVEISQQEKIKTVCIPLYTYLWGEISAPSIITHTSMFFHKDFRDFSDTRIHYQGTFTGSTDQYLTLPNKPEYALHHFSVYNVAKYISGYMRYGEEEAKQKFERGEKFSMFKLLAAMIRYMWIYKRALLASPRLGFLIMLNMAFGRLMTYTRLYELEQGITLDTVHDNYSVAKQNILNDFKPN